MVTPRRLILTCLVLSVLLLSVSAGRAQDAPTAPTITYRTEAIAADQWATRFTPDQLALLEKINRRDVAHLRRLSTIIVPDRWDAGELSYSPLPQQWPESAHLPRIIVVDQPMQVFGAYEAGVLVRWGPVSTGRKETPTPAGSYNLTWKAKSRISTDNDQWKLKWYFNFINSRGVSFHEFDLPGSAASHACVRLLSRDAEWLYGWGEQWRLTKDGRAVETPGTPVIVQGVVDFSKPTPWTDLASWRTPVVMSKPPEATRRAPVDAASATASGRATRR